jgi:hypothetical protein
VRAKVVTSSSLSLQQFAAAVNSLGRKQADKLMREHKQGRRMFGAVHTPYPLGMLEYYYKAGQTPEQAFAEINGEESA